MKKHRNGKYYYRNECKPCRVKENTEYKKLPKAARQVACKTCGIACTKKMAIAFCSLECRFIGYINKTDSCWLWIGSKTDRGYGYLGINKKDISAHRFSYEHFNKKKIEEGNYVLHSCNIKLCVNPLHLRQGSAQDNSDDWVKSGGSLKGEKHPASKLTEEDVFTIRSLYKNGNMSQNDIGKKFNVSQVLIGLIVRNKSWKE